MSLKAELKTVPSQFFLSSTKQKREKKNTQQKNSFGKEWL